MAPLTEGTLRSALGELDEARHPLLRRLSRDEIHDGGHWMAPGGLLLADMLAEALSLEAGEHVLDLGCGRGQSSVFLASQHRVQVTSLDLWISAEERRQRAAHAGVQERITPLQGDIRRGVPVAAGSLDAIFCLQSFHCFGTRPWVVRYLASLLKPGGRIGIAQGCFREEVAVFPPLFAHTDGWNAEYDRYHSPGWWRDHLASEESLQVTRAEEVQDGDLLWDEDILQRCARHGWSAEYLEQSAWLIRHVLHGKQASPSLTHCLVVASKRRHSPGEMVKS